MANALFNRQLGLYASVHRDMRNRATHFVGIPIIVFSLLLVLTLWRVAPAGGEVSLSAVVAIVAVLGWLALDLGIGLVLAVVMLAGWYGAEAMAAALGPSGTWGAFAALFVGGWAIQFLGHHYEGKRPALMDNIFQAFIGPMFLVAETMIEMGYRRDLANVMGEGDVTAR
ncbi:MAG: DUF962 domain-containing protein [Alphaproteobacteria bacterium]|nr:DUF962 domain-containing protein [Alphaproteobacteria bacterium]MBV8645353.1 DUF962 domain-containing protein [Candidatus Eremiobacteraeota bacterium]